MKEINWNPTKNQQLITERGVSFEDVVFYLQKNAILDDIEYPNRDKYPNQRVFVISIDAYVYLVPYVEDEKEIFLKTIIPSRKATRQYSGESND
ncbi:MAG: BrnT family toxin [Cocleimonas sp.]|nr:BrnT family toxin [Cocleimonas sp.]